MSTAAQTDSQEQKTNDKEFNFRALEAKHKAEIEGERKERERLSREVEELKRLHTSNQDDSYDEPYVDQKKLNKELAKLGEQTKQFTKSEINQSVQQALEEERQNNWLKNNSDFYDVMQNAERIYQKDPELAETILKMPDNFERKKLVYRNIKAMGLDRPESKQPSIQEKIDANRKSPYYQPSGVATAPYQAGGDYSEAGMKSSYEKMQQLKKQLRLG